VLAVAAAAAVLAVAAAAAVLAVAEPALVMATGPTDGDARAAAPQEHLAVAADGVRVVRVAVRVAPRPVLTGNRQLLLDGGVVVLEIRVVDRSVRTDAVRVWVV